MNIADIALCLLFVRIAKSLFCSGAAGRAALPYGIRVAGLRGPGQGRRKADSTLWPSVQGT